MLCKQINPHLSLTTVTTTVTLLKNSVWLGQVALAQGPRTLPLVISSRWIHLRSFFTHILSVWARETHTCGIRIAGIISVWSLSTWSVLMAGDRVATHPKTYQLTTMTVSHKFCTSTTSRTSQLGGCGSGSGTVDVAWPALSTPRL